MAAAAADWEAGGGGSADRSGDELPPRSSLRDLGIWW